jgi:hypothetical protein
VCQERKSNRKSGERRKNMYRENMYKQIVEEKSRNGSSKLLDQTEKGGKTSQE